MSSSRTAARGQPDAHGAEWKSKALWNNHCQFYGVMKEKNTSQCFIIRACFYACVKLKQQFLSWLNFLAIFDLMEIVTDR